MASHSRSSAAMRSSNQWRTSRPSLRSGVAVRPSSSTGCEVVEQPLVRGRGGVVELVDDRRRRSGRVECVEVGGVEALDRGEDVLEPRRAAAPPTHFSPNDGVAQRVAEGGEALVEDLLAVGDEEQSVARERRREAARSRPRPSPSCRCRSPRRAGCGGAPAGARARSARAALLERPSSSSIGLSSSCGPSAPARCARANSSGSYGTKSPLAQ